MHLKRKHKNSGTVVMNIAKHIQILIEQIKEHRHRYYVLNQPILSDYEYDKLEQELRDLEENHPELIDPNSPTQRIGTDPVDGFRKIKHQNPMLSLDNTYSRLELFEWRDRVIKGIPGIDPNFAAELKIDGISLSLTYENRILAYACTRGDGNIGEDVTENAKTISDIPIVLPALAPIKLEVRGEVFLSRVRWKMLNQKREKIGEPIFANPRNAAAGTMRQLDSRITATRLLSFLPWQLVGAQNHDHAMNKLVSMGFNRIPARTVGNFQNILDFIENQREQRLTLPFDSDGVVIKVNDLACQKQLGCTNRVPRWAIAFKYQSLQATTTLLDITWQVGRTGKLTPVANLETVTIGGSNVSRATLHNADELERLGLRIGCRVFLEKGGEVIPKIISVVPNSVPLNEPKVMIPTVCPICSGIVSKDSDIDVAWRCQNPKCPAKLKARLQHLGSRHALDIEGLGEALAKQLITEQHIHQPWEIFRFLMSTDQGLSRVSDLDHMGEKSAKNLIAELNEALTRPLSNWIYALGIPMVGSRTAVLLAEAFPDATFNMLWQAKLEDLLKISEIGPKIASNIKEFTSCYSQLPEELTTMGITPQLPQLPQNNLKLLTGHTIVVSGTLSTMSRNDAEIYLQDMGAKVTSTVSTKTTILVAGDKAGSKLIKAKKLGITIRDEDWILTQNIINNKK
jgi:DNA ligase (NAD+)